MTVPSADIKDAEALECMRIADYAQFGHPDRIPFRRLVYGGLCAGFGDTLIYINTIRHFHDVTSIPLRVSRWTLEDGIDRLELYEQVLSVFGLEGICTLSNQRPTANIDHLNPLITQEVISRAITFLQAPIRWKKTGSKAITYQFDAVSFSELKTPSQVDEVYLRDATRGYNLFRLGKHVSLQENIKLLATSVCFIGIDSGLSQLAYSVGVPMYLMRNRHFFSPNHAPHMGRKATIRDSAKELAVVLRHDLDALGSV